MRKIYCEHGAFSKRLRELQSKNKIEIINFPVDPDSKHRRIKPIAIPSEVQWRDMNVGYSECDFSYEEAGGSEKFDNILIIIGKGNRRDALHVDSAYKNECCCMVTSDSDILKVSVKLYSLLGLRIFSPDDDALYTFLS